MEENVSVKPASHAGHRERLRRALRESGIETFSPHEVIELMLYTCTPRRDVNEAAHRIADAFGGVHALLDASKEDIISKCGVSERAAKTIRAYMDCVKAYRDCVSAPGRFIKTRGDMDAFIRELDTEGFGAFALMSPGREVLCTGKIPPQDPVRHVCERVIRYDAYYVLARGINEQTRAELRDALALLGAREA